MMKFFLLLRKLMHHNKLRSYFCQNDPARQQPGRVMLSLLVAASALLMGVWVSPTTAGPVIIHRDAPTLDRWNYPFNFSPGTRGSSSIFASFFPPDFNEPDFDERDGECLIAFDTTLEVQTGLGRAGYSVTSAVVTLMVEGDLTFAYDPTPDSFTTFLPVIDPESTVDSDTGRSVILSGVGYRNEWATMIYPETGPYAPAGQQFGKRIRNAFPLAYMNGSAVDIANNVEDRFDPVPFAAGTTSLTPGVDVPEGTNMTFTIDITDPDIQCYLKQSLNAGRVDFMITALHPTVQMGSGTFPVFYMKENLSVKFLGKLPARLDMTVELTGAGIGAPGDTNGDLLVNVADLLNVLGAWGPCNCCAADVSGDDVVNVTDLLEVLGNWSA